ncbi:MAG: hypothetical protein P4M08_03170 [Oligoflexia bacterium]|nr:hypothetical protein [Oligoflexia bacterium]
MKPRLKILALIFPNSQMATQARVLRQSLGIAQWLDGELHLMVPGFDLEWVGNALDKAAAEKSLKVPVELHSVKDDYLIESIDAIQEVHADLLTFEYSYAATEEMSPAMDKLKLSVLELSSIPVLLQPSHPSAQISAMNSFIVPVSGERPKQDALKLALHLATITDRNVKIVHVEAQNSAATRQSSPLTCVADQAYHEYSHLLDQVVSEACPMSSITERQRVTEVLHLSGNAPEQISRLMEHDPKNILVLQWKGIIPHRRVEMIKTLLRSDSHFPILIVKVQPAAQSRLNTGKFFTKKAG